MSNQCSKLCCFALGMSFGIVTGFFMMLLAWAGFYWGYGLDLARQWMTIFPGYDITLVGGLIGFGWGLLEGFILGFLIAWIYNLCAACCNACYWRDSEEQ